MMVYCDDCAQKMVCGWFRCMYLITFEGYIKTMVFMRGRGRGLYDQALSYHEEQMIREAGKAE